VIPTGGPHARVTIHPPVTTKHPRTRPLTFQTLAKDSID
jgi:hypothetical protein